MKFALPTLAALSLFLAPIAVDGKPGNGRGNGHGARAERSFCPPGLAKRDPACIPPGQVGRENRDDNREARREREDEDRVEAGRDARSEPPESDPVAALLQILDEIPARPVLPSDAAALDLAPAPAPAPATLRAPVSQPRGAQVANPDQVPAPTVTEPDTGLDLGQVFRRATAEGSVGY